MVRGRAVRSAAPQKSAAASWTGSKLRAASSMSLFVSAAGDAGARQ
ncbi:hypothetical protein BRPE64_ACDS05630 [Caballeronia insecticola]|uniref:Uncharacterized protein n=1 Tax=Caballeronia insecticola TaxID=758793 RepID=R4WWQ6_9BURK|nr:hypothetical protein BRPE64_ACDS05630 [Caballeronia insecticola]